MRGKEEIFAEIHNLIDEQMATLKDKLTHASLTEYLARKNKIDELLNEISRRDGSGSPSSGA